MNGTNRGYIAYARSATSDGVNAGIERQIQAIRQLGEKCSFVKILGSYPYGD